MGTALKVLKPLVISSLVILLPAPIMGWLGYSAAAGLVGLASLTAGLCALTLGIRPALLLVGGLSAGAALLLLTDGNWLVAALAMSVIAFVFGLTARRGWQTGMVMGPITLAFVVTEPPQPDALMLSDWIALPVAFLVFGAYGAGLVYLITRDRDRTPPQALGLSRAMAYAGMLAVVSAFTTAIAIAGDWRHAGGWMIMTPFIVVQPYIEDGFNKSVRRAGGTVIGFGLAWMVALFVPWVWLLYVIGALFAAVAMYAFMRKWDYLIFAMVLTPAVIILEGVSTSIELTAEKRLGATLIGVGLSLAVMALSVPWYRRNAHKYGITHY